MFTQNVVKGFTVKAYQGDAKTLLAFNLSKALAKNLAGFTIAVKPGTEASYYLLNALHFADPTGQVQDKTEPAESTLNAPIQKFRWLHVPGNYHQKEGVFYGKYTYTVTPRYFDKDDHLLAIDLTLSVSVQIEVIPFVKGSLSLGFTRGFVQSQAFSHHFGPKAPFKPAKYDLTFDTGTTAGTGSDGISYTYKDEYVWSGFTAREQIFGILTELQQDKTLSVDVFAYDFNEPDIINAFLQLGKEKRIRILLDNASLHHNAKKPKPEDNFETAFAAAAHSTAYLKRGHFTRFQHNKVFILKKGGNAIKVLTGSTNFSITGIYVNSNHVAIFNDVTVAKAYADVFDEAWNDDMNEKAFLKSPISAKTYTFTGKGLPQMNITFSPHADAFSKTRLQSIADRVAKEKSSVLFAVMDTDDTVKGPISGALKKLHDRLDIFSAGITDSKTDIYLYKPNTPGGIKVTGLPGQTLLPPPFDAEKSITVGHQIHHKFIICGFNTPSAVLWFGSSNLAQGGEDENGDNLIELHDQDIATAFAIEAFGMIDHFMFRDKFSAKTKNAKPKPLVLTQDDSWTDKYFDKNDLYYMDRQLF